MEKLAQLRPRHRSNRFKSTHLSPSPFNSIVRRLLLLFVRFGTIPGEYPRDRYDEWHKYDGRIIFTQLSISRFNKCLLILQILFITTIGAGLLHAFAHHFSTGSRRYFGLCVQFQSTLFAVSPSSKLSLFVNN